MSPQLVPDALIPQLPEQCYPPNYQNYLQSLIPVSLSELTSDIRSKLVEEPSSHVSKAGSVDVQWRVPRLWSWHGIPEEFLKFPPGMSGREWTLLAGTSPLHTDNECTSGGHRKMDTPDGNYCNVFP